MFEPRVNVPQAQRAKQLFSLYTGMHTQISRCAQARCACSASVDVITAAAAATCDVVVQGKRFWLQQTADAQRLAAGTAAAADADAAAVDPVQAIHTAQIQRFLEQHRRGAAAVSSVAIDAAVNIALVHTPQAAAGGRQRINTSATVAPGYTFHNLCGQALRRRAVGELPV